MKNRKKDLSFVRRENSINKLIGQAQAGIALGSPVPYTLPVVFHIISNGPSLITDPEIIAAVQDLNDAFAHTGPYASGPGANTLITFCLASKDPAGGNSTGITRTTSYMADFSADMESDRLKDLIDWDPTRYINIWVVSDIRAEVLATFMCGQWNREGEGGNATMPVDAGSPDDGLVVTGFGIVLAHEMGHYLGLYHTFQGMDCKNDDCNLDGDLVCDTPPQKSVLNSPSCSMPINSCNTDTLSGFTTDVPDLISDFMSYGNGSCLNEFTPGQAARMQATIATVRSSLLQPECTPPCPESSVASFTSDNPYPIPGSTVNFTNTSTGATQFEWSVNNAVVSTAFNFAYTFTASGKYAVNLKAYNANPTCYASYTAEVLVSCGVVARYYADKQTIASKAPFFVDTVNFINRSVNASSYEWLLSDTSGLIDSLVSTDPGLSYAFTKPGVYSMRLVATDGSCADTSEPYTVIVLDPTPDGLLSITGVQCYHNDSLQVTMVLCNNGYAPLPAGTPISFYDANPLSGQGHKLGRSFLLPAPAAGTCCGDTITTIIRGKSGLSQLYAELNDKGNAIPVKLPNTSFPETDYTNNGASFAFTPFQVTLQPTDTTVPREIPFPLNATLSGGTAAQIVWDPASDLSCSNCLTPILKPPYTQEYTIVVKNQFSCTTTASALVTTYSGGSVNIPNAFTPNGDGLNDIFYVLGGKDVEAIHHMTIFTRTGSKIFEVSNVPPDDPSFGWNGSFQGKKMEAGTYVYIIQIKFVSGMEQFFKGTLELIR